MPSKAVARNALASDGGVTAGNVDRVRTEGIVLGDSFDKTFDEPGGGVPGEFPENEPPGFTQIIHEDCSTKNFTSGGDWFFGVGWLDDSRTTVVNDAASKFGTVVEKRFFVGDNSGWNGIASLPAGEFPPGEYIEQYQRKVFKLSPNWQKHGAGEKYILFGLVIQAPTGPDLVPCLTFGQYQFPNGELTPAYPFWVPILPGSPDLSNVGANDLLRDSQFASFRPQLIRGQYHTVEVIRRSASGPLPTDRDGYFRYWFDGQECTRFSAFGAGPRSSELRDVPLNATRAANDPRTFPGGSSAENILHWGGGNDTKTVNDYVRMSEYYVSLKDPV